MAIIFVPLGYLLSLTQYKTYPKLVETLRFYVVYDLLL